MVVKVIGCLHVDSESATTNLDIANCNQFHNYVFFKMRTTHRQFLTI